MWKPHYGICTVCSKNRLLVVKKLICKQCNDERKGKSNQFGRGNGKVQRSSIFLRKLPNIKWSKTTSTSGISKRISKKSTKKPTGEKETFTKILEERGPYSQISGAYLGEGFNPWWFSHIVPKSIAPKLRLDPRNIILKTPDEHILYENYKHKIRDLPEWKWVFELEETLKIEYNNK